MKLFLQSVVLIVCAMALGSAAASVALTPLLETDFEAYKIPKGYYNSTCLKPTHLTFYDWMATLSMPPYEADAFDCSQMSAYVEWLSENCGHNATIAGHFGPGWGHIWVLIDIGGVPFAYEATTRTGETPWIPYRSNQYYTYDDIEWESSWYYDPDTEWESIYDTPMKYDGFEMEYAWWETYPSLVSAEWRQQ